MPKKNSPIRKAVIQRKTNEVDIRGELVIDGSGKTKIKTGFEPLDHVLTLCAFHGFFDLTLEAKGDLAHHIIEDVGIAIGKAFKESLRNKEGICRYGSFCLVMDKVVAEVNIDISGRPLLYDATNQLNVGATEYKNGRFDTSDFTFQNAEEFLESFTQHAGVGMVYFIKSREGDLHHILEALFKALGKALDQAVRIDPRRQGVPSTKGIID